MKWNWWKKRFWFYDDLNQKGFIRNKIHTLMLLDNPAFDKELTKSFITSFMGFND